MRDGHDLIIRRYDEEAHKGDNFCEQIALLFPLEITEVEITLVRSFVYVCQPGSASLDPENPGTDTFEAWEEMDQFIDNQGARGFFHTHPGAFFQWSPQDLTAQNGLAKANGRIFLWHGMQAAGMPGRSTFVCSWMENGRVFRYNYGRIEDDLDSPIIRLELPPMIQWLDGAYVLEREPED
jgi:hypothetical protein